MVKWYCNGWRGIITSKYLWFRVCLEFEGKKEGKEKESAEESVEKNYFLFWKFSLFPLKSNRKKLFFLPFFHRFQLVNISPLLPKFVDEFLQTYLSLSPMVSLPVYDGEREDYDTSSTLLLLYCSFFFLFSLVFLINNLPSNL